MNNPRKVITERVEVDKYACGYCGEDLGKVITYLTSLYEIHGEGSTFCIEPSVGYECAAEVAIVVEVKRLQTPEEYAQEQSNKQKRLDKRRQEYLALKKEFENE